MNTDTGGEGWVGQWKSGRVDTHTGHGRIRPRDINHHDVYNSHVVVVLGEICTTTVAAPRV